jgi:hypothetical protein
LLLLLLPTPLAPIPLSRFSYQYVHLPVQSAIAIASRKSLKTGRPKSSSIGQTQVQSLNSTRRSSPSRRTGPKRRCMGSSLSGMLSRLLVVLVAVLLPTQSRSDISLYTLYDAFSVRLVAHTASEHCVAVQAALSASDGIADAIYAPPYTLPRSADGVTPIDASPVVVPSSSIGFVSLGNARFCTGGKLTFQSIKPTAPPKLVHGSYFEKVINFLAQTLPNNSLLFGTGLLTGCSGSPGSAGEFGLNISGMGITKLPKDVSTKLDSGATASFAANVKYVGLGVTSRLGDETVCIFSDSPRESIQADDTLHRKRKSTASGEFGSNLTSPQSPKGDGSTRISRSDLLGVISGLSCVVIVIILVSVYFELKRRQIFVSPSFNERSRPQPDM